jgi:hypothetical protein
MMLLREGATLPLARRLAERGAPLGEAFAFMSGLYFRGKLTYARHFARHADRSIQPALVITPTRGLLPIDTTIVADDLREFARVDIGRGDPGFIEPLERDLAALAPRLSETDPVILLGSVATGKYADVLSRWLDGRLWFPTPFVGRGDMSRGALLLRSAAANEELDYDVLRAGVRPRGPRPPKLSRLR